MKILQVKKMYIDKHMTKIDIAKEIGVSFGKLHHFMQRHDIRRNEVLNDKVKKPRFTPIFRTETVSVDDLISAIPNLKKKV